MQKTQITAARKYGIKPLKDRSQAEELIENGTLKRVKSCNLYQLAPMGYSIPYLTENAADLLSDMVVWTDNTEDAWYYLAVQEATNSHTYTRKNNV